MATVAETSSDNRLFLPEMTVRAMRDSRYRHPANAIAELIDNSIDARADQVELIIQEKQYKAKERNIWRVHKVAVVDNGHGMSPGTLVQALRFGAGLHGNAAHRIGKYGMGLPTSSVSQCKRVDVWSWENGICEAAHSYIDIGEIEVGKQDTVPEPEFGKPPEEWLKMASSDVIEESGTLVVWSEPDRITQRAETIFNHIEEEIGRIYRHFINAKDVSIRMASYRHSDDMAQLTPVEAFRDRKVRANDPLYLMENTSVDLDGMPDPMFKEYAKEDFLVVSEGREAIIQIVYSIANREILGQYKGETPGNKSYGQHARKNMGISVTRENREISLENYFVRAGGGNSVPMNRWWGCEVSFGRECDDLFGVDHNKQQVAHFASLMKQVDQYDGETLQMTLDLASGEDDVLNEVAGHIRNTTRAMMREINKMFAQRPLRPAPDVVGPDEDHSPEGQAEKAVENATREGLKSSEIKPTRTDKDREEKSEIERKNEIKELFSVEGFNEEEAQDIAETLVRLKKWYKIMPSELDGYQMFSFFRAGGVLTMRLNIHHPIYEFIQGIEGDAFANPVSERTAVGILSMLLSWGRMEDDIEQAAVRMEVQERARAWGRMVAAILKNINQDQVVDG